MKSFDGRRSRSTRAVRFSRSVRSRRSRRRARRLSVPNPHEGAHPAHRDGTSEGSASGRTSGRQRPPASRRSACQGDRKRRSSRPGSSWGVVKRAMHLHASFTGRAPRRAKACRARTKRRKTFFAAGRDSIDSSTKVERCLGTRFGGVGGRHRSHAPLVVWLGSRKRFERRRDVEARGRIRAGSSRRTRSSRESSFERVRRTPEEVGRDERVRRVPTFAGSLPQSGIHGKAPCALHRATRWKASRCGSRLL